MHRYFVLGAFSSSHFLLQWDLMYAILGMLLIIIGNFLLLAIKNIQKFVTQSKPVNLIGALINMNDPYWRSTHMPRESALDYVELSHLLAGSIEILDYLKTDLSQMGEFAPGELDLLFSATKEGVRELFYLGGYISKFSDHYPKERDYYWEVTKLYRGKERLPKELVYITRQRLDELQKSLCEKGDPRDVPFIDATRAVIVQLDKFLYTKTREDLFEFFAHVPDKKGLGIEHCYFPIRNCIEEINQKKRTILMIFLAGGVLLPIGLLAAIYWFEGP
jgi:hypothetical protein